MAIRIHCPHCGRIGSAPDHAAGKKARCPGCGETLRLADDTIAPASLCIPEVLGTPPQQPQRPIYVVQQQPAPQTVVNVQQAPTNGMGTAGFVLSLVSFLTCGILSPLALLFSVIGITKEPRGLAIAGTVLGAIGSLWMGSVLLLPFLVAAATRDDEPGPPVAVARPVEAAPALAPQPPAAGEPAAPSPPEAQQVPSTPALLPEVASFLAMHPEFGTPVDAQERPDWRGGKRQFIRFDNGHKLIFYEKQGGIQSVIDLDGFKKVWGEYDRP